MGELVVLDKNWVLSSIEIPATGQLINKKNPCPESGQGQNSCLVII